jgi:hypothetical protein
MRWQKAIRGVAQVSKEMTETPEAVAAWEAYQIAPPTREGSVLRNAWFDGRAFGLVEGAMSVARPDGQAYALGVEAGRTEERERCAAIIREHTTGHADRTEFLAKEIERGS